MHEYFRLVFCSFFRVSFIRGFTALTGCVIRTHPLLGAYMPISLQEGNGCLTQSKCLIMSSCVLFMNKHHCLTRGRRL